MELLSSQLDVVVRINSYLQEVDVLCCVDTIHIKLFK